MSGFSLATVRGLPWVSLGLFCLSYGTFGWLVGGMIPTWQHWILLHLTWTPWVISGAIATQLAWGFAGLLVVLLMLLLTAPLRIMRVLFGSWLQSDVQAFVSVLGWAFMAVIVACWLDKVSRFLVLLSAAILCHLDLQYRGYRTWQIFGILSGLGLGCLAIGGYLFTRWHVQVAWLCQQLHLA